MDAYPDQMDTYAAPDPHKPRRSNTGLYILLVLAIGAFAAYKIYTGGFNFTLTNVGKVTTQSITDMAFNGKVTQFTFDGSRQNTKVALLTDGTKYAIYDQWVYEIDLGDSLVKEKGSLQINVYKPKKDKVVLDYYPILRRMEIKKW